MDVTSPSVDRLGCGREIDDVWNNADHPPTAHELTCADCKGARASLADLAGATQRLRQEESDDETLQIGPQVIERVLKVARSEVRRGRRLPLHQPGPGRVSELTVSEQAVASVIRRVGDQSDRVQVRRCSIQLANPDLTPDAATSDVLRKSPSEVRVTLRVSVACGAPIAEVVDEVRVAIIDTVDREVGLTVLAVDVLVEDVHDA